MEQKSTIQPLHCPVCNGAILKVSNSTLIKCEHNLYEGGQHKGCDFMVDLKPKILKGQQITRTDLQKMLAGESVEFKVGTATIDKEKSSGFYLKIEFPENELF